MSIEKGGMPGRMSNGNSCLVRYTFYFVDGSLRNRLKFNNDFFYMDDQGNDRLRIVFS